MAIELFVSRKKILVIFGTRPEVIKMAPVCMALKARASVFELKICVTGQHKEMLQQALNTFGLKPNFNLEIMTTDQSLADITSKALNLITPILLKEQPYLVLVHGDTTSAMASALACFYLDIPVGHVEAGLRTYNLKSPFPEELNRQIISKVASVHFAPTKNASDVLLAENVKMEQIFVTGNTVIDALLNVKSRLQKDQSFRNEIIQRLFRDFSLKLDGTRFILVTGHRRENFRGEGNEIIEGLRFLARQNPEVKFIYPVHLSPRVKREVEKGLGNLSNVFLIEPVDYPSFVLLMMECYFIITDSGGIQEEAPSLSKPVLVTRNETERHEAVEMGCVILVGNEKGNLIKYAQKLLDDANFNLSMSSGVNPYGNGKASNKIIRVLEENKFV